jgi:D-lactate dehydrogenase
MKICFVETEPSEREFFENAISVHELSFVQSLADIEQEPDIVSIFIYSKIDAAFLDRHPAVRLVATRSTTWDHIDLAACAKRNVTVCGVANYGDYTVAEHALALILAVARRLREAMALRGTGFSSEDIRGMELRGKTLGVIGAGRVGRHTIALAKAFGMNVVAHDPRSDTEAAEKIGFRYVSLDELLRESDVISLHAALTPETFHILDRAAFAKCRPDVLIINTARGRLIDTEALIEALDKGIVAGAGLDVLGEESVMREEASHIISGQIARRVRGEAGEYRISDAARVKQLEKLIHLEALLSRPNVIFTPHIAFNTIEAIERICRATMENIDAFLAGRPINVIAEQA